MTHSADNDAPVPEGDLAADLLPDTRSWEHNDGTPCANAYGTFRCAEHGLDTRVKPPGSEVTDA